MPNYDEIKKKAIDALETIADVSVEAYKLAEEKARVFAKRAKLTAEITKERAQIRRVKLDIGGIYYDLHKDAPGDAFKESCESISASLECIAANQRELEELKNAGEYCEDEESCEEGECCEEGDTCCEPEGEEKSEEE